MEVEDDEATDDADLNCLQRFDDFMWNSQHGVFEAACTQRAGYCSNKTCVIVTRSVFLVLFITGWILRYVTERDNPFDEARFLSQWGYFFGTVLVIQSLQFLPGQEIVERPVKDRYYCCQGWKWFILMYNITFQTQIVITLTYWGAMFPFFLTYLNKGLKEGTIEFSGMLYTFITWSAMQHALPFIYVVTELVFLNSLPVLLRHQLPILVLDVVYMINNLVFSFARNQPVYPFVDWRTAPGVGFAIFLFFFLFLLANCHRWCTLCKVRSLGHDDLYDAMIDEAPRCSCCCCSARPGGSQVNEMEQVQVASIEQEMPHIPAA